MTTLSDPWRFFDKIYCISIDNRIDRRTEAKKQFADVGLLERVEFIIVKKHPDNQEQGIFQSHMKCLKKGLQTGARNILVFEDDVLIKNFQPQVLLNAEDFLKNTPPWNGFFLGAISSKMTATDTKSIVKIKYRCLAHAYALNGQFARRIVQESWNNIPFDDLLRRHGTDFFALAPMIAFQSAASTDNQTLLLDKTRRLFGGLPFIQRSNEIFQRHKRLIICCHFLIFMALALLIIKT